MLIADAALPEASMSYSRPVRPVDAYANGGSPPKPVRHTPTSSVSVTSKFNLNAGAFCLLQAQARGVPAPVQRIAADVPTTVSTLLNQTRRLEASLQQWSALEISENEVSDVFVAVGNAFHEMLAAFAAWNIDMRSVQYLCVFLKLLFFFFFADLRDEFVFILSCGPSCRTSRPRYLRAHKH